MIKEIFPPIEVAVELEPEELAVFVLQHLSKLGRINKYNYTLGTSPELVEYAGDNREEFCKCLMEAWQWLEREIFIAPQPGEQGNWAFITRKGEKVLEEQDFESYKKGGLLPSESLDSVLVRKVKPLFIRGDYDTAVLQAFKEVEVRVRKRGGFGGGEIGVTLMRKAFKPASGPLTDQSSEHGEQQATMDLFAGAVGKFKNPSSHRDVEYDNPSEVADIIRIANQLLRMVDRLEVS